MKQNRFRTTARHGLATLACLLLLVTGWSAAAGGDPAVGQDGDGVAVVSQGRPLGDFDGDCDTDLADFQTFLIGFSGSSVSCCDEVCDGLDNNCDGQVDEGYRNEATGKYDADSACGDCSTDCGDLSVGPNAYARCDATGEPVCVLVCCTIGDGHPACDGLADYFNFNGIVADGCEFRLDASAIYVSATDPLADIEDGCGRGPSGTGPEHRPCRSIGAGIREAVADGRSNVLVADGLYPERVTLVSGISLLGGYRPDTWERHIATTRATIIGSDDSHHKHAVIASGIISGTVLEGFVIYGEDNTNVGGNSYAVYVTGSSQQFEIRHNFIYAGGGGPGESAQNGLAGQAGTDGVGRNSPGADPAYDAKETSGSPCGPADNREYANGGGLSCDGARVDGGDGGGNVCAPSLDFSEASGQDGASARGSPGTGIGGMGGDAGNDAQLTDEFCYLPPEPLDGVDGGNGGPGRDGDAGSSCRDPLGYVQDGHWFGNAGLPGALGEGGGGGGGGGAGGGSACVGCTNGNDWLGAHGGGGGSGGCGGYGGRGGGTGGSSFGIFVANSVSAPVITHNTIYQRAGGNGASGGTGGLGGDGGRGGMGGVCDPPCFCAGDAGDGGHGGRGGSGGGGGAGCGGSSFGVFTSGLGTPNYCDKESGNAFHGGTGGAGGAGGQSLGRTAAPGMDGTVAPCHFD